jgi:colanic acid/amylovoran biosynthesis glycosyltransferase
VAACVSLLQMGSIRPVVIFRNRILPYSETFILAQGERLERFQAHYVGLRLARGLEAPADRTVVLNRGGLAGALREFAYSGFGRVPDRYADLGRLGPALLHAHFGTSGIRALPLTRRLGVPLVVTFHGSDATRHDHSARGSWLRRRQYLRARHTLAREAALIIAVSPFIKDSLIEKGFPEDKIVVHYIGVDTDYFTVRRPVPREPVVLFVGRLVEKKGCEYLIRAMGAVQQSHPDAELVILGDGPLRARLEEQAGSQRKVRFLGAVSPGEVKDWMTRARVLSVPSVRAASGDAEGFGMVFAEANALGLPVASFASGGIVESVAHGETGLLAAERDWETLGHNISKLLEDPELWDRMSRAGERRVRERFDLTKQTRKLEDLYDEVLSRAGQT